jgi:CBS domain-containing protein
MKISDLMTKDPACCTKETTLKEAANMMIDCDCGQLPVCDSKDGNNVLGVITDRDIVCRAVAEGKDMNKTTVGECMSTPAVTGQTNMSLDDAIALMEFNMIRRLPVMDNDGCVCGIVSISDIACKSDSNKVDEVVREVSKPTAHPSNVTAGSAR